MCAAGGKEGVHTVGTSVGEAVGAVWTSPRGVAHLRRPFTPDPGAGALIPM